MPHRLEVLSKHSHSRVIEKILTDTEARCAPIDRLPVELLGEIFLLCAGNKWYPKSVYVAPDPEQAPLLLCRISHQWRSVALSIPSLWSSLLVVAQCSERTRILAMTKLWLKRAASAPLSIHIESPHHSEYRRCKCNYAARALDVIISHIQCCNDVTMDLDTVMAGQFLKLRGTSVPGLQNLTLNIEPSCDEKAVEDIIPILASFPNLRRFRWIYTKSSFPFHIVPWSQLTHICLTSPITTQECVIYLAQCTVATNIQFDWVEAPVADLDICIYPAVLPRVKKFKLRVNGQPAAILQHFRMPSLKTLFLSNDDYRSMRLQNIKVLGQFIEESPLRDLTIINHVMLPEDIVQLLTLPTLFDVPRFELWAYDALMALDVLKNKDYMVFSRLRSGRTVNGVHILEWGPITDDIDL